MHAERDTVYSVRGQRFPEPHEAIPVVAKAWQYRSLSGLSRPQSPVETPHATVKKFDHITVESMNSHSPVQAITLSNR